MIKTEELNFLHDFKAGLIKTISGVEIELRNPKPENIKIGDIAHALSHICRFGGHTKEFYSVAMHSVLVAKIAPIDIAKEALLHDAAEAYLGDVIKPLKHLMPEYEVIEKNFMNAIIERFGLDDKKLNEVKKYDQLALEIEYEAYVKGNQQQIEMIEGMYGKFDFEDQRKSYTASQSDKNDFAVFFKMFNLIFPQ